MKLPKQNIETTHLLLLPYDVKYAINLFYLVQKNRERLTDDFPKLLKGTENINTTKEYVLQRTFDWNKSISFSFLIFEKSSNILIGHFNIKNIDAKKQEAEFSYFIDIDFGQRGWMTEAVIAVLQKCFSQNLFQHIHLRIDNKNHASLKLAEKLGFKYEGAYLVFNQLTAANRYGISKEEFEQLIL